jgi:hypothetical protein
MKKSYLFQLSLLAGSLFSFASMQGQTTIIFQNFAASKTVIPTGWTQELPASETNKGWVFGNKFTGGFSKNIPAHGYYALVDDYDNNTSGANNNDTLYSPSFSCVGHDHVFISFDANVPNANYNEYQDVVVSSDGGMTWTSLTGGYGLYWNTDATGFGWQDSLEYDISQYAANQPNVMVAFSYNNGNPSQNGAGGGMAVANIDVFSPYSYDLSTQSQNLPYLMQVGTSYTFTGAVENFGGDSIVTMHMNYSVNGGATQTDAITAIASFSSLTLYTFTHNIPFKPTAPGSYTVKFWADNFNGNSADGFHPNDTLKAVFTAISAIQPKVALLEEFMNASCDPCMYATPNVDSVSANNLAKCNVIRYHVDFPGRDFMDDETWTPFVNARATYYSVAGVPDAKLDGTDYYPGYGPGGLSSANVRQTAAVGSPFAIDITSATYTLATNTFALSANITSYGTFPAGIVAQVVLTVDTITYKLDQSDEDPQGTFAPPIGTTTGGTNDSLYPGLLAFPSVAEGMLTPAGGTALLAFTTSSSQTISASWKVSHPWGSNSRGTDKTLGDSTMYDSTKAVHLTVFLQDTKGEPTLGVPALYVYQSASSQLSYVTGMQEIANGVLFAMYPNPASGTATVIYELAQEQNVKVEVMNLMGETLSATELGISSAGKHKFTIHAENLASGIYMVRFSTNTSSMTQRLVIQNF